MKNIDVTALGEILIDFTYVADSSDGNRLYQENTGGAPANCAACVSKLGGKSLFIGCTGHDSFGEDVRKTLQNLNVDISQMQYTSSQHTTLAFVTLSKSGERSFSFCRNPGADTQINFARIDKKCFENTKIFHIGSLSLTDEPARDSTLKSIIEAKKNGAIVSYDPNWREALWGGRKDAFELIKGLFTYSDIVKVSDEELHLLFGNDCSLEKGADILHGYGVRLLFITLGKDGAYYSFKEKDGRSFCGKVPCAEGKVVDTTGAGDSFFGGVLYCLTRKDNVFDFTGEELYSYVRFGNAVATVCVSRKGAIPALPTLKEAEELLEKNK